MNDTHIEYINATRNSKRGARKMIFGKRGRKPCLNSAQSSYSYNSRAQKWQNIRTTAFLSYMEKCLSNILCFKQTVGSSNANPHPSTTLCSMRNPAVIRPRETPKRSCVASSRCRYYLILACKILIYCWPIQLYIFCENKVLKWILFFITIITMRRFSTKYSAHTQSVDQ